MIRRTLLVLVLSVVFLNSYSQDGILSKLYFPLSYGINFPLRNPYLSKNFMNSEGIEYRFKNKAPWFARLTVENLNYDYAIENSPGTNVSKSELTATGYYLSAGVRKGNGKLRFTGAFRAGGFSYRYPQVSDLGSRYEVTYVRDRSFSCGIVAGIEYYFSDNIAAIVESHYMWLPSENIFWEDNFQNVGISLGITTTLF
ncbi:MAG: hypothetical protein WCE64_14660 [Bacteroidales bacterium]